ncbi:MAG: DNA translocase FtsK 4TM domain-containing protein [Candidatus Magasanikbacteria bacterium]
MSKKRKSNQLNPSIAKSISSILLIVLSLIIALSFLGKAGEFGKILNQSLLGPLFGSMKYSIPLILLLLLWFSLRDQDNEYKETYGIGIFLFLLSACSLFHFQFSPAEMRFQALQGNGGGVFGLPAWILKNYLGTIAGVILLIGLLLTSLLLTFNTSLAHFILMHKKLMNKMGGFGDQLTKLTQNLFVKEGIDDVYDQGENLEDYQEFSEEEGEIPKRDEPDFSSKDINKEQAEEAESREKDEKETKDNEQPEIEESSNKEIDIDQPDYMKGVISKEIPPISLLSSKRQKPSSGDIKQNVKTIKKTLKNFDLEVEMGEVKVGPTVTQYTLNPPKGVKLNKITSLSNNLSLALAAHPIRIEAPIPGKSKVGVEVPNETQAQVTLKELLKSKQFKNRDHDMMMALGKDVSGKVWFADLPKMPHLLIAGATGSGKTVCLNTIIMSLLYQNTPETLRFIMVDPKRVELKDYDGLPHLLTPVITKAKKAVNALEWTIKEMERRFDVLSESGSRNISSHNKKHPDNKMPHLVFIIDELADLMQAASNEIESGTIRLAQMARAVGIHLILATQRPSVDVITGLMKANIPARISFSVASATDSRVILDEPGAEKLVGKGDMLLSTSDLSKPARIQGAYISEQEVKRVVDYLSEDEEPNYDESIVESQSKTESMFDDEEQEKDELFEEAKKTVLKAEKGSASLLQRKLRIGYARAARILDQLHEEGIVGEARGSKAREITLSEQEIVEELDKDGAQNVYKDEDDEEKEETEEQEDEEEEEKTSKHNNEEQEEPK